MATAAITISATASGLPEGGLDQVSYQMTNTSAAATRTILTLTTAQASAQSVIVPTSGQFIFAFAPSTNTGAYFVTASTAEAGVRVSSNGCVLLRVAGGTSVYFYAAAGGAAFALNVLTY